MKKISKIFIAILLVIVAVFGVAGCNAAAQNDLQSKIDELQTQIADLQSQNEELQSQIEALEQEIERKSDLLRENVKSGLYSLQEVYDMGLLTREDLMSIAYYQHGGRTHNEEIMPEDYTPQPKTPEVLSEETQLKIKSAAAEKYRVELKMEYAEADGFTITQYYGTYGNCVAVILDDDYTGGPGIYYTYLVAGVEFYFNGINTIFIWIGIK